MDTCDKCGKEIVDGQMYETAEGDYVCQDCYTSHPEEE